MKNWIKILIVSIVFIALNLSIKHFANRELFKLKYGKDKKDFAKFWGEKSKEMYIKGMENWLRPRVLDREQYESNTTQEQRAFIKQIINKIPKQTKTTKQGGTTITENLQDYEYIRTKPYISKVKEDIKFLSSQKDFNPFDYENISKPIFSMISEEGINTGEESKRNEIKEVILSYIRKQNK